MLKHIFVLSMMIISLPSFATDVSGGEICDTDVLNTDTGPVNLRAEFEPEVINLKWYNGDNQITVPTTSNSCTYDTPINLPTDPVKPGYKFKGWRVLFDLSTLDASIGGKSYGYVRADSSGTSNLAVYGLTTSDLGKWGVTFRYGKVIGESICSSTGGEYAQSGTPDESGTGDIKYCWCKATGYVSGDTNSSTLTGNVQPVSSASWVFYKDIGSSGDCAFNCAFDCGNFVHYYAKFRAAVFGVSGS